MRSYLFLFTVLISGNSICQRYITGNAFRSIADHIHDETRLISDVTKIKHADIVFLKTDYLEDFFVNIFPKIEHPFILITHNSDYDAPGQFKDYLDSPKIIKMFSQNPTIAHPKLVPIPIGVANNHFNHGKEQHFDYVRYKLKEYRKKYLVGIGFKPAKYTLYFGSERSDAYSIFSNKDYSQRVFSDNHILYLSKMAECNYIVSPRGNGLDTHRAWEALLVGSIPIVMSSPLDKAFDGLPVLVVNNWNDINKEELIRTRDSIGNLKSEKMFFEYWSNLILSEKTKLS
jgi:hypothetical protein